MCSMLPFMVAPWKHSLRARSCKDFVRCCKCKVFQRSCELPWPWGGQQIGGVMDETSRCYLAKALSDQVINSCTFGGHFFTTGNTLCHLATVHARAAPQVKVDISLHGSCHTIRCWWWLFAACKHRAGDQCDWEKHEDEECNKYVIYVHEVWSNGVLPARTKP